MDRNDKYRQKYQSNSTPNYKNQNINHGKSFSDRNGRSYSHNSYRNKTNFAVSFVFIGTASSSIDNKLKIEGIWDELKELTGLMKDHKTQLINHMRLKTNKTNQCYATGIACLAIR